MSDRIVADVRRFSKSTGYAKFLLVIIASHINPKAGYAHASLDTLAREVTLSKPTVIKLILILEALGELDVERGHGRGHSNRYRITIAHEASDERPAEDDPDQPKGKGSRRPTPPDDPDERSAPDSPDHLAGCTVDNPDHAKGQAYLYLLPPLPDMEKVNNPAEKVKSPPLKGQPSVASKEVLRTSKENTEREAFARAPKKVNDPGPWVMEPKAEAASPFYCAACGYSAPTCAHRVLEVVQSTPTGAVLQSAPASKEMRQ